MSSSPYILTSGASHFFGFHDITPWNTHMDELICLRTTSAEDHIPTWKDEAEIVAIDEASRSQTVLGVTRAWNWQKGARQRWLPSLGERVIAYNAENKTGFECRIVDLNIGGVRILPLPLYDIHDIGGFGLTLNFRKLFRCQPGYGYDHPTPEPALSLKADGIFRVDVHSGKSRLILSMADFLRDGGIAPDLGEHYFTHIQISPDGKRFAFMHRCFLRSGALVNNFVVAATDGSSVKVLLADKMSHFDWRDNDHILVWCRKNAAIKRLKESKLLAVARTFYRLSRKVRVNAVRQGLYNESFREINVCTGESTAVGKGVLTEDGHPQVNPRYPGLWINDTYPDAHDEMTLMLYHQPTNRRLDLLRLKTQPGLKETCWRCDFHPRWHPGGRKVCFDSAHLGRRQLCVLDVSIQSIESQHEAERPASKCLE
jgi:hypothetical protein